MVALVVAAYTGVPALVATLVTLLVGRRGCSCEHAGRVDAEVTREIRRAPWWRAADRAAGLSSGSPR